MIADARLKHLEAMAAALVARAYDHDYGFYHSARCLQCGAIGSTRQSHGGPPVKRGDVLHKGDCPVGIAHDVLETPLTVGGAPGG